MLLSGIGPVPFVLYGGNVRYATVMKITRIHPHPVEK